MKALILILVALLLVTPVFADLIMPGTHAVNRCVTIDNIDDYPEYALVAFIVGPGQERSPGGAAYEVHSDNCLSKGYKFNGLQLYWTTSAYLESVGIEGIGLVHEEHHVTLNDSQLHHIDVDIEPYGGYTLNTNPLVKERIIYHVAFDDDGFTDITLVNYTEEYESGLSRTTSYEPGSTTESDDVRGSYTNAFLLALVITLIVETGVIFALRKKLTLQASWQRLLLAGIIPSLITLPIVWFILVFFIPVRSWLFYTIVAELFAFLVEAPLLKWLAKVGWPQAFLLSLLTNLASFLVGLLLL